MADTVTRRDLLKYGLFAGLATSINPSLFLSGCGKVPRRKSNLLLVSIDTLRADHVSCYGYRRPTTANIDRLASEGHLFSRAYTTIPTTLPAHASMFTSLYPTELSVRRNGEVLSPEATTLAGILTDNGYSSTAFVSSQVMGSRYGIGSGFQLYDDRFDKAERAAADTLSSVVSWLDNRGDGPFFMFVHFMDPHTFYSAPDVFCDRFGAPRVSLPPSREFVTDPDRFTPALNKKVIAAYDAEIAYADWAVGELLAEIARQGLEEDTLVIVTSDHGESLDELLKPYGYAFDHGEFLYSHQLAIPLIVRLPGESSRKAGQIHSTPASLVDILPTVLDILSVEPQGFMHGRSLLPLMKGKRMQPRPLFMERRTFKTLPRAYLAGNAYSMIEDDWQHIVYSRQDSELYDLSHYAGRTVNQIGETPRAKEMEARIQDWVRTIEPLYGPGIADRDRESLERLRSLGYTQ